MIMMYCGVPLLEASDGLKAMQFRVIQARLAAGSILSTEHIETLTD